MATRSGTLKRFIELSVDIKLNEWPDSLELAISFGDFSISEFCCELQLLIYGYAESLTIKSDSSRRIVSLRMDGETSRRDLDAKVRFEESNQRVDVVLGKRHVEYWLCFFLKYYRDGLAEVDHIHLEDPSEDREVTIIVSESQPPMPGEEARRILLGG
jgi:hypothetical protein